MFNLLSANEGRVVDRDTVARTIWGKDWEDRYSDQAIDKVISNLRNKFEEHSFPKMIRSVKGKGLLLT